MSEQELTYEDWCDAIMAEREQEADVPGSDWYMDKRWLRLYTLLQTLRNNHRGHEDVVNMRDLVEIIDELVRDMEAEAGVVGLDDNGG